MVAMRSPVPPRLGGSTRAIALASVACVALVTFAPQAAARPSGATDPAVDSRLQQRVINPRVGSDVGLIVIDAATGDIVSAHNADRMMLPASNMKIITAVNAISAVGVGTPFHTRVLAGETPGDVVLQGGGDPLLSSSDLQELASSVARALPPHSKVVVHVDGDLFPAARRGPGWTTEYLPYVAAPVVALARLGYYGPDPSGDALSVFVRKLRALGIGAKTGKPTNAVEGATVLADTSRHTVGDAVQVMLSRSENNIAEVLYRHVALATGHDPSWSGARDAAEANLAKVGIDASGMLLLDGSGLSRKDRVSPRFLTSVLRLARITKPAKYAVMFTPQALPVSGRTGTLSTSYGRYVTPHSRCARGDVHAKTGSLYDTISLSGVAVTVAGGERLFSILVNHRPQRYSALSARQVLDGLTATITGCWP
jgi:D-alanyl-D-alanine carboxypeptidase/D-alanyl-D-alanine-endopeptidase (penicillin-binding protein 4)